MHSDGVSVMVWYVDESTEHEDVTVNTFPGAYLTMSEMDIRKAVLLSLGA